MITCMVPYHTVTVLIWYIDTFLIHSGMGMHMHVQHHVLDGHYTTQLPADPLFVCQVRHDVSSMSRVTPADCRAGHDTTFMSSPGSEYGNPCFTGCVKYASHTQVTVFGPCLETISMSYACSSLVLGVGVQCTLRYGLPVLKADTKHSPWR